MVVVGAGVIGIEYASMFAALGTKVTVVEKRDRMLDFCDSEIVEALKFHLRDLVGDVPVRRERDRASRRAARGTVTTLAQRQADPRRDRHVLRRPAGRRPTRLDLDERPAWRPTTAAGSRSTTTTRPTVPHIYAVGDVIGFPALAATSMEQGRLAAYHAFGEPANRAGRAAADRHLHDPRDLLLRADRGAS